jgi:hypothetical protein
MNIPTGMEFKIDEGLLPDGWSVKYDDTNSLCRFTFQGDHGAEEVKVFSPECCGWLQVSGLQAEDGDLQDSKFQLIKALMTEKMIVPTSHWSFSEKENTRFPLYCVTTEGSPEVVSWLTEQGWTGLAPFKNPNTDNICMPFYWPLL